MHPYTGLADTFKCNLYLNTKLELSLPRETVLTLFESLQKSFPTLTDLDRRDDGEITVEEDREQSAYRWIRLSPRRLAAGCVNPQSHEFAQDFHTRILEIAPYHLGLSGLDTDILDITWTFELDYTGNHDDLVAEAIGRQTAFESMLTIPNSKIVSFEPWATIALDDECRLQFRVSIETRTTGYQIRTGRFPDAPISVHCTLRQFWSKQGSRRFLDAYHSQTSQLHELVDQHVIPQIVRPLQQAIASR
ncbi:hypothetical protein [Tuwongella immobilis]|uniref:Uncharacterized protein n=1 Tax=Tuwongella immobilis TaxID=692036 RepID=A0A6C2YGV3_9BACT|nr:hypothetical protein [Tuwongella immobilis]VIP00584.1 Uncharacterized protein OS=Singulisphaera acidiphila (strain ATCC BAA-1392 / DSM 18658 / VKM B-2454 / MOB10) GN=Sinac_3598 PE=4 SV=1 [Tuwongella immobilis]VTR96586.1 Uncharacterized protein OS=Singulisphaera acidiphila (strain ATCC BAA-1392 / DSM 18658 / VKM B-2454 / MOB10) GN=Sinac_3598 PE=4 SV=1 [Tuwongella immobilis]